MKKETNSSPPWWLYVLLIAGIYLGGAIGAVASGVVLFGLWFVWNDKEMSLLKKVLFSSLLIMGGVLFYLIALSFLIGIIEGLSR